MTRRLVAMCALAALLTSACTSAEEPSLGAAYDGPSPGTLGPNIEVAAGQEVEVTEAGPNPGFLVSTVELGIRWRNRSDREVVIVLADGTASDPIPPGGSFSYTPTAAVAIRYEALVGDASFPGAIQVEPPLDPGEKPVKSPPPNYPDLNWPYASPAASP